MTVNDPEGSVHHVQMPLYNLRGRVGKQQV